ncbi:MAG TPA: amidohydrolase family protein [Aquihabitans sp.]|nr:amidohydrolase family protein [Aquihabitans sp.]
MYAADHLLPWLDALREALPPFDLVDAHLHVGLSDPAGYQATPDEVVEALELADASGIVFPVGSSEGYRAGNDTALELAAEHPDRLVALARVEPSSAVDEAARCLELGARGLKLHPRGDGFDLADERLDDLFALADERRLPIVVHAGVGSTGLGDTAAARARANPGARLVLAHCAIGAFEEIVPHVHEVANLFLDTSWWNPSDLWAAYRMVPPGQLVHASDVPFNSPVQGALMSGRLALQAGLTEGDACRVLGSTARCLVDGADLPDPGALPPNAAPLAPELERLYVTLCSAVVPMLAGEAPGEGLELAKVACRARSEAHDHVLEAVGRLLALSEEITEPDPLRPLRTPGFDVVLTAALVARTPDVPVVG